MLPSICNPLSMSRVRNLLHAFANMILLYGGRSQEFVTDNECRDDQYDWFQVADGAVPVPLWWSSWSSVPQGIYQSKKVISLARSASLCRSYSLSWKYFSSTLNDSCLRHPHCLPLITYANYAVLHLRHTLSILLHCCYTSLVDGISWSSVISGFWLESILSESCHVQDTTQMFHSWT